MSSRYFLINSDNSKKIFLPSQASQKFSIGRTPNNSLQIVDSTVSKNHSLIYLIKTQNKYILQDLGSVNGTFINNQQLSSSKRYLKHNDMIQFGKSQETYYFKNISPQPQKKGKVNFKDYHFQLDDVNDVKPLLERKSSPTKNDNQYQYQQNNISKDQFISQSQKTNHNFYNNNQGSKISISGTQQQTKSKKQKFQRVIKIPKFQQFLQLQGQPQLIHHSNQQQSKLTFNKNNNIQAQPQIPKKWPKNDQSNQKRSLIKLPQLNKNQLSNQDKALKNMLQRKKQLQRAQKQAILKKTQQQQHILQQRLRLQIQKSQQQQQILREKYQFQKKSKQQQRNLLKQKQLLQQKLYLHEKQMQKRKQLFQMSMKQKQDKLFQDINRQKQHQLLRLRQRQQQLIKQLQQQKNKQVKQIQIKQVQKRQLQQQKCKQQLENRKRQLQLQAEALTKQYQNIYKETIKKMKLNLQQQKQKVNELQNNIQKIDKENIQFIQCLNVQTNQLKVLKQQFDHINGRNKAFLMYASHLQNKIDALKLQKIQQKQNNLSNNNDQNTNKNKIQLKQSIINSRKLLNIKLNEQKQLQTQIKDSFLSLNVISSQSQDYFNTILQNYQQIKRLKQFYFQFLQQQKSLQNRWDLKLSQNNELQDKIKNMKKQLQMNKKKLNDNLNENLKKLTQQRVHMLKMLYYVPEQKKNAAKFLVQEMLKIGQQKKTIIIDSQNVHTQITSLILQIQQKKIQNQYLSNMLFGGNQYGHHFDNMKQQINQLIYKIDNERQQNRIFLALKSCEQIRKIQNDIFLQMKRQKKLKEQLKNNGNMIPALNTQKNPLVFFGNLLIKKENQLNQVQQEEKKLQKGLNQIKIRVNALNQKKNKMGQVMEEFKRQQLKKVRAYLQ